MKLIKNQSRLIQCHYFCGNLRLGDIPILHGGNTSQPHQWNKEFFYEITKGLKNNAQVLICYFARENDEYDKLY